MNRKRCAIAVLVCFATAAPGQVALASCQRVYIGTQGAGPGQGIVTATLDTGDGRLGAPRVVAELPRPTWVMADPRYPRLYAASDPRGGAAQPLIASYAANPVTGDLSLRGRAKSGGKGPTHLAIDPKSRTLFVANFDSGQLTAMPVPNDGSVGAPVSIQTHSGSGPDARQTRPHTHGVAVDPSSRWVVAADLGADRLFVYRFDPSSRQLSAAPRAYEQMPPGSGPRHVVFHQNGRLLFVLNELTSEVRSYRWDPRTGHVTLAAARSTLPDGYAAGTNSGAEIVAARDGRHIYVSNRGEDTIVTFAINEVSGALTEVQRVAAGGRAPWSFGIDPSNRWLLVTNQGSGNIAVLAIDRRGMLSPTANAVAVVKPVSVAFLGRPTRCR